MQRASRNVKVAAAQLGPIQKADTRQAVVARMLELMRQAKGCDLIVYPELALTTFFPRWHYQDRSDADIWFERDMPSAATRPLFEEARRAGMAMSFGYAELTPGGQHFNTSILVDKAGIIVGKYRKVHLPGHDEFDPERSHQHLEKRYFEPGDLGFPAWPMLGGVFGMCICNDRRWPETYRVMGLQGVEIVALGYNTPTENIHHPEPLHLRMFHHILSLQSNAYQNATWVLAAAKCGAEDGFGMIGGSAIVAPTGEIAAQALTEDDELIGFTLDLELGDYLKRTVFAFERHRRVEHYGLITERTGAKIEV
jgi:predicted amidohydrolase